MDTCGFSLYSLSLVEMSSVTCTGVFPTAVTSPMSGSEIRPSGRTATTLREILVPPDGDLQNILRPDDVVWCDNEGGLLRSFAKSVSTCSGRLSSRGLRPCLPRPEPHQTDRQPDCSPPRCDFHLYQPAGAFTHAPDNIN